MKKRFKKIFPIMIFAVMLGVSMTVFASVENVLWTTTINVPAGVLGKTSLSSNMTPGDGRLAYEVSSIGNGKGSTTLTIRLMEEGGKVELLQENATYGQANKGENYVFDGDYTDGGKLYAEFNNKGSASFKSNYVGITTIFRVK